jgi:1,4-dihydroxy-6-naphthoate synthase
MRMSAARTLAIAFTPASDDAFHYFALETGRLSLPGFDLVFQRAPLSDLNRAARVGLFSITAISSVLYPLIADRYAILSVGTSVGRGYGPVVVSRRWQRVEDLRGKRVGVPGVPTTGWFLLRWLCPEAVPVEMAFDKIGAAVARGDLDAGVMIHEELLSYPKLGLRCVADLGAAWCAWAGLPLPVGLNVVRRDISPEWQDLLCALIRDSLAYAGANREVALDWVGQFGRGAQGDCTERLVSMFANEDSLRMPPDVRAALLVLFHQVVGLGLAPEVPRLDIAEGQPLRLQGARRRAQTAC